MGLCAGFAVVDFKSICWGKIGLVDQPLFIEQIRFVNPTNYIYSPIAIPLFTHFLSFAHTNTEKQEKTKDDPDSENQMEHWHRCSGL